MRVGLLQVDGKYPNLALMKISAYHKKRGDTVEFYSPLLSKVDVIYASKVFTFTPDYQYFPSDCEIVYGGSGYDIETKLPDEIENQCPDYALYNIDYAIGFTTRGCIRRCPFCIVPEKEGTLKVVADIDQFWRGQRFIRLLDNNLTAAPFEHFQKVCEFLIKHRIRVDFNQGLDIRLITDDHARLLSKVPLWKQIHFAFDHMKYEEAVRRGIAILKKYIPLSKVMFYVLIGYDTTPEEDLYRVEMLRSLGVDPYVMVYQDPSNKKFKKSEYQKRFQRWVNHKAIFKSVGWWEYKDNRRLLEVARI